MRSPDEPSDLLDGLAAQARRVVIGQNELDKMILNAHAAGHSGTAIANRIPVSKNTVYRLLEAHVSKDRSDRYVDLAPHLVREQPDDGLAVAIGTDPTQSPLGTFVFDEAHPVLAVYHRRPGEDIRGQSIWPTLATSAAASGGNVWIYSDPWGEGVDLPTYFGPRYAKEPERIEQLIEQQLRNIAAGRPVPEYLIRLTYMSPTSGAAALRAIAVALVFGHRARVRLVVASSHRRAELCVVRSAVMIGPDVGDLMDGLPDGTPGVPPLIKRPVVALIDGDVSQDLPLAGG